jgi:hypothetical protein
MDKFNCLTGELRIQLHDQDNNLILDRVIPNLVVTAGKNVLADRMKGTPTKAAMTTMAVGTNGTIPTAGDTTLNTELARVSLTSTTVTGNQIAYVGTFGAGTGTGTLLEAGVFNNNPGGDMLCRTVFTSIVKGAGDTMTITWNVTVN